MSHVLFRASALAVSIVTLALPAAGQRIVGTAQAGPAADPILLPNEGLFQARFASVGDDLFIAGQPTEAAMRELSAKGVTTVVNLRMPEEMATVGFDEAALVKELGLAYVHIPTRGTKENPYAPSDLDRFATTLASARGKVLLHCTVAWRASHLWAAYLIQYRKVPVTTALTQARAINLRDDQPYGGQQPIEGFLGRPVPELAGPRQ
jgi:uncharacterized protein (TIGR01244 family)